MLSMVQCSPVMCMHTINFRKNCRSLVKYFLTCASTHFIYLLGRPFFNNPRPPSGTYMGLL